MGYAIKTIPEPPNPPSLGSPSAPPPPPDPEFASAESAVLPSSALPFPAPAYGPPGPPPFPAVLGDGYTPDPPPPANHYPPPPGPGNPTVLDGSLYVAGS